ncbi:MAG: hypothetical protein ACR9NN_09740 [Nostochopsis sp.]
MVVGGWWWLLVVGCWWLVVGGWWLVVVGGGWLLLSPLSPTPPYTEAPCASTDILHQIFIPPINQFIG